jgi:hypothetical protein
VDSIDGVRKGPCRGSIDCTSPDLQPIILNANQAARQATPSLRPNDTPEVPRPDANTPTAKASQACAKTAARSVS